MSSAVYRAHMGDDDLVVDAARVSFDEVASKYSEDRNNKLIQYLASHGHWTPFAHPNICIVETVPLFVARQRFKHMVGFVYNEVSRRYVKDEPDFFVPSRWRGAPTEGAKQGSNGIMPAQREFYRRLAMANHEARRCYNSMIKDGVAPEQARMCLPQNMYTSYYVTGSLAAWARAYKQRVDPHAQVEIQELAHLWGAILQPLFPVSWKALTV